MAPEALGLVLEEDVNNSMQKACDEDFSVSFLQSILLPEEKLGDQATIMDTIRRQLLRHIFGVSTALAGLSHQQVPSLLDSDHVTFLEQEMEQQWNLYHTGGTVRAYKGLQVWLRAIEESAFASQASTQKSRMYSLLGLTYQLEGSLHRDMMNYEKAHEAYQKSFALAREQNDNELQVSALARRGVTSIQQLQPQNAIEFLDEALTIIEHTHLDAPSLKGYTLQARSEAYAMAQIRRNSFSDIDAAQQALERRGQVVERSNCHPNTSSVLAQRGVNAVLLKDHNDAIHFLDTSLMTYDPTYVRGRARLTAQKAEAYYGLGLLDASTATAKQAVFMGQSVGSKKTIARVQALYATMQLDSHWEKESVVIDLGRALDVL